MGRAGSRGFRKEEAGMQRIKVWEPLGGRYRPPTGWLGCEAGMRETRTAQRQGPENRLPLAPGQPFYFPVVKSLLMLLFIYIYVFGKIQKANYNLLEFSTIILLLMEMKPTTIL